MCEKKGRYGSISRKKARDEFIAEDQTREELIKEMREETELELILDSLKEARKRKNLTLKDAAAKMGMKESSLSRLENQVRNVTMLTLFKYSRVLGVDINIQIDV